MSSLRDPRYRAIIQKIIFLRESKEMTQVELASSLKKPQSYISKVETFERRLDIIELQDWLAALETDISFLLNKH